MGNTRKSRWNGVKKVVSCATAAALALCLTPAAAFAEDMTSAPYALPTASQAITNLTHDGYKYISVGVEGNMSGGATNRIAPAYQTGYEIMGLNYISAYSGAESIFTKSRTPGNGETTPGVTTPSDDLLNKKYMKGTIGSLQTQSAPLVIMGTSVNEEPDEYIWNYCCWANGATSVTDDLMVTDQGNGGVATISVIIDGTTYTNFPRQVYYETDIIQAASSTTKWNSPVASSDSVLTWGEWVELEKKRTDHTSYSPVYVTLPGASTTSGSAYNIIDNFYAIANTVDTKVVQPSLSNGVYTKQTRYGKNSATGTSDMVSKMEDIYQAPEYFTLSKLEDTSVEKKVTAVLVGYDRITGNYACRKYNAPTDPGTASYGGRVANYLAPISMGIAEKLGSAAEAQTVKDASAESDYVAWYKPEQIAETCDAVFVCDCYAANQIANYLAKASDGKNYAVYAPEIGRSGGSEAEDNTKTLKDAIEKAGSDCGFCYVYPTTMFGAFYAQGAENGMLALITSAYTYPKIFSDEGVTLANLFAYWAKYVWHVNDDSIGSIVSSVTSGMHLSNGEEIGTVSTGWEENADKLIKAGNTYYLENYEKIDKDWPQLKTHSLTSLAKRSGASDAVIGKLALVELTDAQKDLSKSQDDLKNANSELTSTKSDLTAANGQVTSLTSDLTNANNQVTSLTAELAAAKAAGSDTVTINKATVTASDIPAEATTVILGTKVSKISANAFKSSKATKVFVMTKKLKKAKVKNCFKGSKVKTVQVPGSKYSAYKKIFKKSNCGKKVTIS